MTQAEIPKQHASGKGAQTTTTGPGMDLGTPPASVVDLTGVDSDDGVSIHPGVPENATTPGWSRAGTMEPAEEARALVEEILTATKLGRPQREVVQAVLPRASSPQVVGYTWWTRRTNGG